MPGVKKKLFVVVCNCYFHIYMEVNILLESAHNVQYFIISTSYFSAACITERFLSKNCQ